MNEPRSRVASQSICILLCCTLIVPGCVSSGRCKKGNCDDGYGVLIEEDGTVYTGEFKDGLYQGKGEIKRPNGTKGSGLFRAGKLHGMTTITRVNGERYTMLLDNGEMVKPVKWMLVEFPQGHRYEGSDFEGKFTFADGDVYVGQIQDGKMGGTGTLISSSGKRYVGEWKAGEPVPGRGIWYAADGKRIKIPDGLPWREIAIAFGMVAAGAAIIYGLGGDPNPRSAPQQYIGPKWGWDEEEGKFIRPNEFYDKYNRYP